MINFENTSDSKPIFTRPDGKQLVDLTQASLTSNQTQLLIYDYEIVSDYMVMRPDIIAHKAYRNSLFTEYILKFNGISNPFSLNQGDIIFLPELDSARKQWNKPGLEQKKRDIRSQYLDNTKAPTADKNLKTFENREIVRKPESTKEVALPPNIANIGDKEIKIQGGKIVFGGDVVKSNETCDKNTISKSEFLAKMIKNKLLQTRLNVDDELTNLENK